jgi:hypothetical protein
LDDKYYAYNDTIDVYVHGHRPNDRVNTITNPDPWDCQTINAGYLGNLLTLRDDNCNGRNERVIVIKDNPDDATCWGTMSS